MFALRNFKPNPPEKPKPTPPPKTPSKPKPLTIDYREILAKYDAAAIANSPIQYFSAVRRVADESLNILQRFEAAQSEPIAKILQTTLKLGAKYTANKTLTPEENQLLADRQKFLATRLAIRTDETKSQILSFKAQAEKFFERLAEVNRDPNSIWELGELEQEPRPNFVFLTENLVRLVQNEQDKLNFFVEHEKFILSAISHCEAWSEDYKTFKTKLREELAAICRDDDIDEEIFGAWYEDWRTKRFAIEQRFFPLIDFAFDDNFDFVEDVLKILREYRAAVDEFYLRERKNIYQRFAFIPSGDLQEKFETESAIYKLSAKFHGELQKIIFARDKTPQQIFLLDWSEPLLSR